MVGSCVAGTSGVTMLVAAPQSIAIYSIRLHFLSIACIQLHHASMFTSNHVHEKFSVQGQSTSDT